MLKVNEVIDLDDEVIDLVDECTSSGTIFGVSSTAFPIAVAAYICPCGSPSKAPLYAQVLESEKRYLENQKGMTPRK